ncbi:hypothetical protein Fcan01_16286 [Folsomia candida]|uniref:Uncharacterized protein n=1 Tax=Folsomia candida TaxID=158441 RepID=A0A226DU41_FOLCA|nr:hypothetical protein Fcan01_16286 [Folsomia candida]
METMSTLLASLWISFGFIFSVTCNFVSVRMYRVIPMPFYLVFPVGSLGATVAIMVLFPYGIACHDVSSELLEGWRMKLKMKRGSTSMRDLVKLGDALRPVGIRVGSVAISFAKQEHVAFCNDFIRQVEQLGKLFPPSEKQWDTLAIILSIFIIISATLPVLYGPFVAMMTIIDKFSHLEFTLANTICPLETYFFCRFITFLVLTTYYGYLAFHGAATLVGAVLNGAVSVVFPVGSIGATVGIMILLPFGIACHETSSDLLVRWKKLLKMSPPPPGKKRETLTIILSILIIISTAPAILFAILAANMTLYDKFSYFEFTLANAVSPLETYFACKAITFLLLFAYYGCLAFHSTASLVAVVISGAVVLNLLINSLNNMARMNPNLRSFQIYQRFYILNKTLETISSLVASLLLSLGFVFTVTGNFVSVRMYRVITMPFYPGFPICSLIGTVGILMLLPYGIACHETSRKLLVGWRKTLKIRGGTTKYEDKMGGTLRPVGIGVGSGEFSFFMLKKSTKTAYYVSVTDYTINALMS